MPITAQPDPQNPGKWIWVDSATGQPATQPGGPGTPYVAPSDTQVPTSQNIDPNASRQQGPPSPGQGTTPSLPPTVGAPKGAGGMYTVDQATEQTAKEVQQANVDVTKSWDQVNAAKKTYDDLQAQGAAANPASVSAAATTLNSAYSTLSSAQSRVETANAAYSKSLTDAIKLVDPNEVQLVQSQIAKADADAAQAKANAQVLIDGADTQKAKVAAEAVQASALAAQAQAQADATKAKTPAEVATLQQQASLYGQQADQIKQLLPGLLAKQQADTTLTEHQVGLTDAQSDYYQAQGAKATADANLSNAQATQTVPAQAGLYGAQAAEAQANVQKGLLGPTYGLQDQVNAIRAIQSQVFGPGGSGDAGEADDLLKQYVTSTLGGTTPYAANVAAANYGQNIYQTQAALTNAAQQAMASRANAYAGAAGNVLGTLAGLNANAPAGSTAMAGAFNEIMQNMASQMGQGGAFAPPAQPNAPQLPAFLARMAGIQAGQQGGPGSTSAPVTINIGGAGAGGNAPPNPMAAAVTPTLPAMGAPVSQTIPGLNPAAMPGGPAQSQQLPTRNTMNIGAMPGAGPGGQQSTGLPGALQQYAPATTNSLMSLWGNELGQGSVQMPQAVPLPNVPGVM